MLGSGDQLHIKMQISIPYSPFTGATTDDSCPVVLLGKFVESAVHVVCSALAHMTSLVVLHDPRATSNAWPFLCSLSPCEMCRDHENLMVGPDIFSHTSPYKEILLGMRLWTISLCTSTSGL